MFEEEKTPGKSRDSEKMHGDLIKRERIRRKKNKIKLLVLLILVLLVVCAVMLSRLNPLENAPDLRITCIYAGDDSDGDAMLLQSQGYNLLMDTGNVTAAHVIPKLKEMKIQNLDIYLSHWHDDHYGQICRILNDDYFTVQKIYLPASEGFEALYKVDEYSGMPWWKDFQRHWNARLHILEVIEAKGIETVTLSQGSTFPIGSSSAEVIFQNMYPDRNDSEATTGTYVNNTSLVTMVTTPGGIRYLAPADIEKESEEKLLESGIDVKCNIFKMCHHGASTSNTEEFLEAVSPDYAFYNIKEKKFNRKPYYIADTVTRMSRLCNVFSGASNGDITFSIYGGRIVPSAEKRIVEEEIVYRTGKFHRETAGLIFCEGAKEFLFPSCLPEGAVYISGGTDIDVRIEKDDQE